MKWSEILQPPSYLAATRQIMLNTEFTDLVVKQCGIIDNMQVLEVGCGTGCFSQYLSRGTNYVKYIGLDRDQGFIDAGEPVFGTNEIQYVQGTAYEIPFDDNSFDLVYSYTFFNCVEFPEIAIKEMLRVLKRDAPLISILSLPFEHTVYFPGEYPNNTSWHEELRAIEQEYIIALEKMKLGPKSINLGCSAVELPFLFKRNKLDNIHIFPLPYAFSLSDSSLSKQERLKYMENITTGELIRLNEINRNSKFSEFFSTQKTEHYKNLLEMRRVFWNENIEDNSIWELISGTMLLVKGIFRC